MAINNGVGRIGIRSYVAVSQQITTSTLLNSLYSVWNADTLGTSLDTSIFGAWNGEDSNNVTVKNAWNANGNAIDSKGTANGTIVISNGTTGVTTSTMSFGTGKLGSGAFTFNGSNFIQLPADTFNFTGDFSVSMWVYLPSTVTSDARYPNVGVPLLNAFDNKNGYTSYRGWGGLSWYGNRVSFDTGGYSYGGSQVTSVSATMSSMNQWVHLVGTRKYASTTTLYINGVKMAQANITSVPTYNTNNLATIGGNSYAFSNPWFYGTIAGVKIDAVQTWNGSELDQAAVTELYNSGAGQEYPFTVSNVPILTLNDSVGSNNGTSPVGSVPTFTTGKIGNAFTFDGVNDYIQLPSNSLNFTGDFSISAWAYFPTNYSGSSPMYILSNWNVPSWYTNPNGYFLRAYGNEVTFGIFNNGTLYAVTSTYIFQNSVMPASWHHIAATRKGSAASKLYIDGVLVASNTSTLNPTYLTTTNPTIGAINVPGNVGSYPAINGSKIDSVSVWNKTLSDDEIVQLYNAGNGTQYPFSSKTLSSSANQLGVDNGTLMNGCTFGDGKIGKAFTFDGVNDYVALPDNSLNINSNFSASAWVKYTIGSGIKTILSNNALLTSPTRQYGWGLYLNSNNILFQTYDGTSTVGSLSYIATLTSGTWYHITVTKSGTTKRIYLNGSEVANTSVNNITYTATHRPTIGGQRYDATGIEYFSVSPIDGLSVWQREITQAEVTELYNSGTGKQLTPTPIVTNGLVLNLDAGRKSSYPNTGTIWTDISGNGNNGTMTNGPIFGTASGGQITFDGIDDNVNMGSNSAFNLTNISISIWVKLDTTASNNFIVGRYFTTTVDNGWFIYYSPTTQKIRFEGRESEALYISNQSTNNYNVNTWYNIVCTKSANTWSIYSNGVLDMSQSIGLGNVAFANNNMQFGGMFTNFGNNYGKHSIGSIHMYNRALSATEITQNFNATKSRFGL